MLDLLAAVLSNERPVQRLTFIFRLVEVQKQINRIFGGDELVNWVEFGEFELFGDFVLQIAANDEICEVLLNFCGVQTFFVFLLDDYLH